MDTIELLYPDPACDVYYNSKLNAAQSIWKFPVSGRQFREILDNLVRVLKDKNCSTIVADARKLTTISKDDQEWIIKDWYPRAHDAGWSLEMLIVKKDTFNEYVIQKIVHHYNDEKIKTVYFYSYADAEKWLLENSEALLNDTA